MIIESKKSVLSSGSLFLVVKYFKLYQLETSLTHVLESFMFLSSNMILFLQCCRNLCSEKSAYKTDTYIYNSLILFHIIA
jgi:hypothetical protein